MSNSLYFKFQLMRTIPAALFFSIIFFILAACSSDELETTSASNCCLLTKTNDNTIFSHYDYCEKDNFLNQYTTLEEKIEATQIDIDDLKDISSRDLLILILNNPLINIFPVYNNHLDGLDIIADRLNVFKEFEGREDAASVLLDLYASMKINTVQTKHCMINDDSISVSLLTSSFIELYIASLRINNIFISKNLEYIKQLVEVRYQEKCSKPYIYSGFSLLPERFLLLSLLPSGCSQRQEAKKLYSSFLSYLQTKSPESHGPYLYGTFTINTLGGHSVTAWHASEITSDEIQQVNEELRAFIEQGVMLDNTSGLYNCHAYAWYMADNPDLTNNKCWINKDEFDESGISNISLFWTNDYYTEVNSESQAQKIYYSNGDHSAIKTTESGYYISKWGLGPLMKHTLTNVPYLSNNLRYFSHLNNQDGGNSNSDDVNNDDMNSSSQDVSISIIGDDMIVVGNSYIYQSSYISSTGQFIWSITAPHDREDVVDCNITGSTLFLSVSCSGEYLLTLTYISEDLRTYTVDFTILAYV